jgi:hypothetical protein
VMCDTSMTRGDRDGREYSLKILTDGRTGKDLRFSFNNDDENTKPQTTPPSPITIFLLAAYNNKRESFALLRVLHYKFRSSI